MNAGSAPGTGPDGEGGRPRLSVEIVPVTVFGQNCCLLFDPDDKLGVVVDPGGDVDRILAAIGRTGITATAIWLTHGHLDHAGGAMALKERLGVEIVGPHEADRELLQSIEKQAERFGAGAGFRNAHPDRWLTDGDRIGFGRHLLEVRHCPGHSPGHVVFFPLELAGKVLDPIRKGVGSVLSGLRSGIDNTLGKIPLLGAAVRFTTGLANSVVGLVDGALQGVTHPVELVKGLTSMAWTARPVACRS